MLTEGNSQRQPYLYGTTTYQTYKYRSTSNAKPMLDVLSGNFMFWQYETLHISHLVCEAI
jgi:hypothetical protein